MIHPIVVSMLKLALACVLGLAGVTMFQDRLLYFPAPAQVAEIATDGLQAWPSAQDFRGLASEPGGSARGTVIVFHGNAGHAGHRAYYAASLARLGFRVLLAEYPGYGPRGGDVGERSLVEDARETVALAYRAYGPPLVVIGESLGAGVAAAAVAQQREQVAGLMLITPWDRLVHVAAYHYPWLPVSWLLRDRYDSISHLAGFGRPVLVVVAGRDRVVPSRLGIALHEALRPPKRLVTIEGAGHNDWPGQVDARWWQAAMDFLLGKAPP
ncbi:MULTISPECIES: alpha/beta fold hydrolase [unclassified Variovorax]|uniref:alpha/beta hydrolase n=1 Tax=unclassified Variovorax TaxID=663243 RepID=UPI00076D50C8|nr:MULTISPECIES: alpha/beta fold hydrolase [unclassified Variovorax]KWT76868.1 putative alpha/beta hydrolase BEM46 [Variovorax sp. WDL1]